MAKRNFVREKRIYCGKEWLEVDIVPVTNIPEAGIEKKEKSSKKQKNLNDKNSKRKFVQVANANFTEEDLHISATYDDKHLPKTLEEAERNVHNYLDRVKRRMKKVTGQDLKYMLVTEYTPEDEEEEDKKSTDKKTKAVRIHHHIIINGGLSRDDLEIMWTHDRINWKKLENDPKYRRSITLLGYVNCDRLQPNENGIEGLVKYIDKRKKGCKKWSTSQNLVKPVVKKNDHKYSFRKLREYAKYPEDKEVWRKRYQGYEPTKIEFVHNDYTGWSVYLRLRKLEGIE
ncbi:hypothetical protein [Bacteroides sp.]|uniref:hypothetical protein n=1 Tax=Bacteroides sp. TaxID=29523 RepID=UPI002602AB35|nr:hypothetical protein [Bacteroides sp.]MDD3040535.1 hypothetical protein [Bacteroides sp.]